MIKLRIRIPGEAESLVSVDKDEVLIGRTPDCDVSLPLAHVSGQHAKLICGVAIVDMNSTNGVWSEGQQIQGSAALQGTTFFLGASPEASPSIEVLEASSNSAQDQQLLQQLQLQNQQLQQQVIELETALAELMPQPEPGAEQTLMMPLPGSQPEGEPESSPESSPSAVPPNAAPKAPAPEPSVPDVPSFADFFNTPQVPAPDSPAAPPMPAVMPANLEPPKSGTSFNSGHQIPSPVAASTRDRDGILRMIDSLIKEDVGDRLPLIQGPVEEFFTLESFRLLRQVERVITRLAREFKQLYSMTTMLPDSAGNFRSLAAEILMDPDDRQQRQRLVDYLDELRRWLGVSLAANRKAAQRFMSDLKKDLSAEGLSSSEPIPNWMKAVGQGGNEYWRRAQEYLKQIDDEFVEERLEKYAMEFATNVMERNQGSVESLYS